MGLSPTPTSAAALHSILLAYDGTDFDGWQVQPNRRTVQGELERVLAMIHGVPRVGIVGAGRTDRGVHALGQVASYRQPTPRDATRLHSALQRLLPADVRVLSVDPQPESFHACRSALGKRYSYRIINRRLVLPFETRTAWQIATPLDLAAMQEAARMLPGRRDFASFAAVGGQSRSTVRSLERLEPIVGSDGSLSIEAEADGFLYRMVRIMVGLLVEAGRGRRDPRSVRQLIENPRLGAAAVMAPPQGLCLVEVRYPPHCAPGPARFLPRAHGPPSAAVLDSAPS